MYGANHRVHLLDMAEDRVQCRRRRSLWLVADYVYLISTAACPHGIASAGPINSSKSTTIGHSGCLMPRRRFDCRRSNSRGDSVLPACPAPAAAAGGSAAAPLRSRVARAPEGRVVSVDALELDIVHPRRLALEVDLEILG